MAQHSTNPATSIGRGRLPPLAGLEAVREVALHASLSAAAGALGLTPGALSRRVAAVETWLGTPLFERHGRGMRPTPDGQRFLARIEEAFALIELAADPWRPRRGPEVVRLSVLPSFAHLWLLRRLEDLEGGGEAGPRLRIEVTAEPRNVDVEGGEADMAVRYGRGGWPGVDARGFMCERLTPVASETLARRLDGKDRPADMLDHPLLLDSDASGWRAWFEAAAGIRFKPRPRDRRLGDYWLVLAAAEVGLGIALARSPLADAAIRAAGLVRLSPISAPSPSAHFIVTRQRESRPSVRLLVERLIASV